MKELEEKLKFIFIKPIWILLLGIVPCFLVVYFYVRAEKKISFLAERALYLKEKQHFMEKRVNLEETLLKQMRKAKNDYLENTIESMQFMLPEIQKLTALLHAKPDNTGIKTRLDFLQNGQNTLRFRQQNFQRLGNFQEMEAIQLHPVEMNCDDLKNLLAHIENVQIGTISPKKTPPDLLIKHFELIKKPLPSNEDVFLVNLELIKRELIYD